MVSSCGPLTYSKLWAGAAHRQVHAAHLMEQWPHVEARVVDGVLVLPQPRWQDFAAALVLEGAHLSLQFPIAFPQPRLVELVQGDRLARRSLLGRRAARVSVQARALLALRPATGVGRCTGSRAGVNGASTVASRAVAG